MKGGLLISFEGIEGCGKSTQIVLLGNRLKKIGKKIFLTREPGGTVTGDSIRKVLLDVRNEKMSAVTETLLYMASRAQLVSEVLKPRIAKGAIVLCDRWMDSTIAYQGFAGGVDAAWIEKLGKEATQGLAPKLTLFLDLPVKAGLTRARKRRAADRIEKKDLRFHEKVRQGFLSIARQDPKRVKRIVLRSKDSPSVIHERVFKEVMRVL